MTVQTGGMSEGETFPPVFVVDSQANYAPLPSGRCRRPTEVGKRLLPLLTGLALLGVLVEGCFIVYLYNKLENVTNTDTFQQTDSITMNQIQTKETHGIPMPTRREVQPAVKQKPAAHLIGTPETVGNSSIVQWRNTNSTSTFTYLIDYHNGCFYIQERGHYYFYTKVVVTAPTDTRRAAYFHHRVMRVTGAYNHEPFELSSFHKRLPDRSPTPHTEVCSSFLSGVFHLLPGDKIYVSLDPGIRIKDGAENFMGAFLI